MEDQFIELMLYKGYQPNEVIEFAKEYLENLRSLEDNIFEFQKWVKYIS